MAMNIISKEKKEIKWIGLPTNSAQECQNLEVHCCPFMFRSETLPQAAFLKQVVLLSAALVPAKGLVLSVPGLDQADKCVPVSQSL